MRRGAVLFGLAALLAIVGCGGSGGGSSSSSATTIEGSLSSDASTARVLSAGEGGIAGVEVSALGDTTMTDQFGNFTLSVDGNTFTGGSVQFYFLGAGMDTAVILEGVTGGPGATAYTNFILENSGVISGESTDAEGNVLGRTPGGRLGCSEVRTFVDGGLGALWKPHSEKTGTPAVLMPPEYRNAELEVFNVHGEVVDGPIIRNCCEHNGGREHAWLSRSAESLAGAGVPLTVRFRFANGFTDCRTVPNPTQRYD